ncbi:MAG: aspartyl/asparaginyl beta-hydroxylase domain-containing protein [Pseudomonadota bacterium]
MLDWRLLLLALFVGSALYVHYRGQVRHKLTRQLTDHSTFLAPINLPLYAFSAVPNDPYVDRSAFPELDRLKDNWEVIRDEGLALLSNGEIKAAAKHDDAGFHSFFKTGWKRFYLKWYGDSLPSASETCPQTVSLLKNIPNVKAAMFTVLPPDGYLGAHRDPYAGSLRYHLGLLTPNDDQCSITVDGQVHSWRDGEDVVFDETFIHHAENRTDKHRLILFCDVERPMSNPLARAYNRWFSKIFMSAAATQNREGEKVGFVNRVFGLIYPFRLKMKALKKTNRKLYYAIKYVFFGGLFYFVFIS